MSLSRVSVKPGADRQPPQAVDAAPPAHRPETVRMVMGVTGAAVRSMHPETPVAPVRQPAAGTRAPYPALAAPSDPLTSDPTLWVRAALIDNARNLVTVTLSGTEQAVQVVVTGSQATIDQLAANGQQLVGVVRQSLVQSNNAIQEGEGKPRGQGRRFQRGRSPSTP